MNESEVSQVRRGTYSEIGNVAHSKCERYFNYSVVEDKPEPQNRCYPKSKANTYAGVIELSQ